MGGGGACSQRKWGRELSSSGLHLSFYHHRQLDTSTGLHLCHCPLLCRCLFPCLFFGVCVCIDLYVFACVFACLQIFSCPCRRSCCRVPSVACICLPLIKRVTWGVGRGEGSCTFGVSVPACIAVYPSVFLPFCVVGLFSVSLSVYLLFRLSVWHEIKSRKHLISLTVPNHR